jgi:hypothetical protein
MVSPAPAAVEKSQGAGTFREGIGLKGVRGQYNRQNTRKTGNDIFPVRRQEYIRICVVNQKYPRNLQSGSGLVTAAQMTGSLSPAAQR